MTPNEGSAPTRKRGSLRIYLGAAPGVGKTFAMLNEGRRGHERGKDVVVGFVETHARARTADQLAGLEVVPRRVVQHRDAEFTEMDLDAVLHRRPDLVLVDEFAHTNVPGSKHAKRWEDVDEILDAGIDVVSTVNIQHLESLNDVVESITGIHQRETVPDEVVRAADQIELVDMDPDALRRRMAHGNIYAADKIDAALGNYFRPGNLSALRELALLWVANRVDDELSDYRARHGITKPWETRERVIVALSGAPGADHLIRRASRIAQRARGELIGAHVVSDTGLGSGATGDDITAQRRLLEELGGEYRKVTAGDIATALVELARSENATQIVLGASARSRWQELTSGSVINRVVRLSGPIDVHVISRPRDDESDGRPQLTAVRAVVTPLSPQRQRWGWAIALVGVPMMTLAFANLRDTFSLTSVLLSYLVLSMVVALVGGVLPASVAVLGGFLLADWYFTPPLYRLSVSGAENAVTLVVYVVAAGIVAVLVDRVGRSRMRAARSRAEAEALVSLAGALTRPESVREMLGQLRTTFAFSSAGLLRRDGSTWTVLEVSGDVLPADPHDAVWSRDLGGVTLVLDGGQLSAGNQRMLDAFAAQVGMAAEAERLQTEATKSAELAAANTLRTSLLQAVSHDLRTPLAAIKASISSLRQHDIDWPPDTVREFQETIESETDRLTDLVANLLDMSRVQASAVTVDLAPTGVEETVLIALANLGPTGRRVQVDVSESLTVSADAVLLERSLANLVDNAVRFAPEDVPVRITAGTVNRHGRNGVDIHIIDRGPGIRPDDRQRVLQPFQRLVDNQADGSGVGLGVPIAHGFISAMGGELLIEDTPGGGVTMVISLPVPDGDG